MKKGYGGSKKPGVKTFDSTATNGGKGGSKPKAGKHGKRGGY